MSIISWAARRQIQALSDSVSWSLGYISNSNNKCNMSATDINKLLEKHDLNLVKDADLKSQWHLGTEMDNYVLKTGGFTICEVKAPSSSDDVSNDFGQDRAGANWNELDNFIITSAFVRLLGSLETFETDMLKALLYYRPNGLLGLEKEQIDVKVNVQVILEEPENLKKNEYYSLPPIWTWIRKHAYSNLDRRKILANVFKLDTKIDGYAGTIIEDWYECRNAIAHGRKRFVMTLREYCDVEIYAIKVVNHFENECKEKMRIII
jgi:hypothetical protein